MMIHDLTTLPIGSTMLVGDIDVPPRLRDIDPDYVALIAASIEERGLQQAIVVRLVGNRHVLVAGAHRLEAVKSLGWFYVGVTVKEMSDAEARLVEIDENLCRRSLSPLDQAFFLLERKNVYETFNPAAKHGGDRKGIEWQSLPLGLNPRRFTATAAEKTGLSERAVRLAIQIASALDPEVVALLRKTKFADNQDALLNLSRETPVRQRTLARELTEGGAKTLAAARVAAGYATEAVDEPQARHLATLLETWVRADEGTRAAFLRDIGAAMTKGGALKIVAAR